MNRGRGKGKKVIIGIDGGGTETLALAYDEDGRLIGEGIAGPSNPHNVGADSAVENILSAMYNTGFKKADAVCVALAGMDTSKDIGIMKSAMPRLSDHIVVEHDAFAALYAETRGSKGVLCIAGTGSIVLGYDGSERHRICDYGWLLGDDGSGYRIGCEGLRKTVKMLDGEMRRSILASYILDATFSDDLDALISWGYSKQFRVDSIAALSKVVDRAASEGDKAALKIINEASVNLARGAAMMSKRIGVNRVYTVGGVFESALYHRIFKNYLLRNRISAVQSTKKTALGAVLIAADSIGLRLRPNRT
jgi:N-acetylglucosamine kinase-like BadF-type ATPase